jgi:hypothetical protein
MTAKQSASLSTTARSAIVSTFVDALSANESTGSLVTQVCDVARKYLKGEAFSDEDRNAVVSDIAKARGWKGASAKSRISECNVVLRAYGTLPEAIETYRAKAKRCQWHDSMKLARRLNAGDTVAQAVRAAFAKSEGQTVTPSGRVAGALKSWFKVEPRKQKAILEAAALLGIKLGVKLDA